MDEGLLTDDLREDIVDVLEKLKRNENPSTEAVEQATNAVVLIGVPVKDDAPMRQLLTFAIREVSFGSFKPSALDLARLISVLGIEGKDDLQNNVGIIEALEAQAGRHAGPPGES